MSTIVMNECWPLQGMSPAQKSVLVSLADNANDEGACWPSVAKISERTCLSERAVRNALRWLEGAGILKTFERTGRSTWYQITPAAYAPRQEMPLAGNAAHAGTSCPPPRQVMPPTPAPGAPRTIKEPSGNHQGTATDRSSDPLVGFDRFWSLYPKKRDHQKAQKAWTTLKPSTELQQAMLAALARQVTSLEWKKALGQYIPHPTTWLNGRRWEDELGTQPGWASSSPPSNFTNLPTHTPEMYQEAPDGQSDF